MALTGVLALLLLVDSATSIDALGCRVRVVPAADRTDVHVSVTFTAQTEEPIAVTLPTDYYGSPPLYQWIKSFTGAGGCEVAPGHEAGERIIRPDRSAR